MSNQELLKKYSEMIDEIENMARQENDAIFEFTRNIYSMLDDFKKEIEKLQ